MEITYLGHSGFSVIAEDVQLVFDPVDADFEEEHLFTCCFISHRHGDHFDRKHLERLASSSDVMVVSADCLKGLTREEKCWIAEDLGDVIVRPGERYEVDDLIIYTAPSNDEGVAFLVETPWGGIYHAGDLNDWDWKGEDQNWIAWEKKVYADSLAQLACHGVDLAFVPVDPRLEENAASGMRQALETLRPRLAVAMHFAWDASSASAAKAIVEREFSHDPVAIMTQKGEHLTWNRP